MAEIDFKDLTDGGEFVYNDIRYKKIPTVRVSCCSSFNAAKVDDLNSKIMVRPLEKVKIDE